MQYDKIYQQWQAGELKDQDALEALIDWLNRVQDSLKPLEETEKLVRAQLSEVVERQGGRSTIKGFGNLSITRPTVTARYDRQGLDRLVERLQSEGQTELAGEILAFRSESMRSGYLQISRAKEPKPVKEAADPDWF